MEKFEIVNSLYKSHKDYFTYDPEVGGLHNLLWQILINGRHKENTVCFYIDAVSNELILPDNLGGFWKTCLFFKDTVPFNEGVRISNEMNRMVFGISDEDSEKIINNSMNMNIQNLNHTL